jgi:hypothetical protein
MEASTAVILPEYLADVAREMQRKSAAIRRDFSSHRLSAGENREDIVSSFLLEHLPKKFGVSNGLIISHDGVFSRQADLVVVDEQNNAPLYGSARHKLWPAEAVYALIEVKTTLNPADLADAIAKGRRFKTLQRRFCNAGQIQRISDSLFVIWAFDAPASTTLKTNLIAALTSVPRSEQPDFIIVPHRIVARAGTYFELSRLGQPGSAHRAHLLSQHGPNLEEALMPDGISLADLGENALLVWYVWFDSWLRQAGIRLTDPNAYIPPDEIFGKTV